jgi:hypothetical protein
MVPRMFSTLLLAIGLSCHAGFGLAEPEARSEYTSLDASCKELPAPSPTESAAAICRGRDGMRVIWETFDARSWIRLLPAGAKDDQEKQFQHTLGPPLIITGKRLEWRYHGPKLVALIVRANWWERREDKDISGLIIWRVDTTKLHDACVIGRTSSNEEARAIADDLNNTCLEN